MAIVKLDSLSKRYDGSDDDAVRDLSLDIADGEFMVLLGPSGCGKSTALRMVAGLESISAGTLSIDGMRMNSVAAKDRDIAMVFQSYALYPHMNVRDNMAFGLRRRGLPCADIDRAVADAASLLGLTPYLERKPYALSGGQRQRVALGRAIVRKPKVFLFDEPLSNLDASLRVSMRGELIKLHQRLGATIIYVTHDQVEAMTMGTRVCIMQAGRAVQIGAPLEIYRRPANTFVASFLGNPPMNLISAGVEEADGTLSLRLGESQMIPCDRALASRAGQQVTLGLRPEDLSEGRGDERGFVTLAAKVVAVEPLGAETLLVLSIAGITGELIARVSRNSQARAHEVIDVHFAIATLQYFDTRTTDRVSF